MNKINTLVATIKGQLSEALQTRIERLKELEAKLQEASQAKTLDPSEKNQLIYEDLEDTVKDYAEDLEQALLKIVEDEKHQEPIVEPVKPIDKNEPKKASSALGVILVAGFLGVLTLGVIRLNKK